MGVGKTTIAKQLSKRLNRPFIDLDEKIEQENSITIAKIFNQNGEAYFREKESAVLFKVIENNKNAIIALGGGTLINEKNVDVILDEGTLVFLDANVETLLKRLKKDTTKRPLLSKYQKEEELLNFIQSHRKERLLNYKKANVIIQTDNKSIDEIVIVLESTL
jgi:shikimate kinase